MQTRLSNMLENLDSKSQYCFSHLCDFAGTRAMFFPHMHMGLHKSCKVIASDCSEVA